MTFNLDRSDSDARSVVIAVRQAMPFSDMSAILDPSRPALDETIVAARLGNLAA